MTARDNRVNEIKAGVRHPDTVTGHMILALLLSACGAPVGGSGSATTPENTAAGLEAPPPPPPLYAGGSGRHIVSTIGDSTCVPMAALLQQFRPDLLIANHCRNGAETPEVVDHQWALNTRAMMSSDVLIILAGVNDVSHNLNTDMAIGRILGIADEAVALGIDAYIVVTLPYRNGFGAAYDPTGTIGYLSRMAQLQAGLRAAPPPVHVVDLVSEFAAHQELYVGGSDWVHPNEIGQAHIAEALAEMVP